jgi:hypothetical protein
MALKQLTRFFLKRAVSSIFNCLNISNVSSAALRPSACLLLYSRSGEVRCKGALDFAYLLNDKSCPGFPGQRNARLTECLLHECLAFMHELSHTVHRGQKRIWFAVAPDQVIKYLLMSGTMYVCE